jgi:maltose O-acetyltransferase
MSALLHAVNVLNMFLPVREIIGLRRALLRMCGIVIGKKTRITQGVKLYHGRIIIGSSVWIGMNSMLSSSSSGRVFIGDNVDIGPCCLIVAGSHQLGTAQRRAGKGYGADIVIGAGTWVGAGACILAGAKIGAGSVVAAGSVVGAGTYPPDVLLAGVPAQPRGQLPRNF